MDPGLQVTGYGVISIADGVTDLLEAGVIRTFPKEGIASRLHKIHSGLSDVIKEHRPDTLAIEKIFAHYKHPATAILMGHARGVVCLLSGEYGIHLASIPSTHVKKLVTGRGHADKRQVQKMIQHELGLKEMPEPPDVADAIAIAMAYGMSVRSHGTRRAAV